MLHRNFEEQTLGKIKTVYPDAYTYRQEKGLPTLTGGKQNVYQLTVDANLSKYLRDVLDARLVLD